MQTRVNQSLTPALLRELAGAKAPCITVAIQTGGNARARLRDVVRQVEAELKAHDANLPKEVFEPFHQELQAEESGNANGSLVILSSPDFHYRFVSDEPVKECVVVNDEFHIRSLLPLLQNKTEFYILALSQKHLRMLHCTESDSGEVALPPDVPGTYNESRETRQPDHVLDNRAAAGPSSGSPGKGVMFGTNTEKEDKDEFLLNYYKMIDRGVNSMLRDSGVPVVVVAVEKELALYRTVNTYPHLIEPGVHGAPDGLKGGEMHKRALELLRSQPVESVQRDLEHFDKHAGTGHASSHGQEIVRAAYEGRVAKLYLQETAEYRGTFDEVRRKVKRHGDGIEPLRDLLNEAVIQTLRHGGDATVLPGRSMPNGVPFCATFRYPSPELQAAMKANADNGL